jgi:hypothetical protein
MSQDERAPYQPPQTPEDAPTPSAKNDHYSTHHRKPKNVEVDNSPRNKSTVLRSKHDAWHLLYDALPAQKIIELFIVDQEIYGNWTPKSATQQRINEEWINSSERKKRRRKAWLYLFEGKSLEEIVQEINSVWIDPDYQIEIGTERIKKVWIVQSKK